jgi:hypothetical protein
MYGFFRSFVAGFICSYRARLIAIGSIEEVAATVNLKLLGQTTFKHLFEPQSQRFDSWRKTSPMVARKILSVIISSQSERIRA